MRKRRNYEDGLKLVGEFEQSKESPEEFCAGRGLAVSTLARWRRRVLAAPGGGGLLEVKVKGELAGEGVVRISWPCGVQVQMDNGTADSVLLERLHHVFKERAGACSR